MKGLNCFEQALIMMHNFNDSVDIDPFQTLETNDFRDIEKKISIELNIQDPESILIEKDMERNKEKLFDSLSDEAKDIIKIIIDCPEELKEICFAGKLDKVSIPRLLSLMRKQRKERKTVKTLFSEVVWYANKIKFLNKCEV
jgi:hypothetical protein